MIIRESVLAAIRTELERTYPNEGCGFLVGTAADEPRVLERVSMENHRASEGAGARRYLITPEDFLRASREVARRGLEIVGVYHSHPDVPAQPSAYDQDHAWPWYQYLIIEVAEGTARDVRAWRLKDDRSGFVEHHVRIEQDGGE